MRTDGTPWPGAGWCGFSGLVNGCLPMQLTNMHLFSQFQGHHFVKNGQKGSLGAGSVHKVVFVRIEAGF